MPLRDHFHPPISDLISWDSLHGQWPAMIVIDLNRRLPPRFVASPRIHLGAAFAIDVATTRSTEAGLVASEQGASEGGVATAIWAPPEPTMDVATDLPEQDEYEVQVFETERRRLVAAVEIVSPANKDRPENRRVFAAKCAALLQRGVSVSIVDLVSNRRFNLYSELLDLLSQVDRTLPPVPPPMYAVTCRWRQVGQSWRLTTWANTLTVGHPLPTLPLWLAPDFSVPLNLELSYQETCAILRIP
jgi:hypothetical protein